MKSLIVGLLVLGLAAAGYAQSKVMAAHIAGSEKTVKGAPFSAEALTESVQTFADGNKVVRSSTSRIYRDGEGRFRRDDMPKQIGLPGAIVDVPESILIIDPVSGFKYVLSTKHAAARRFDLKSAEKKAELKAEIKKEQEQEKKAAREAQQKVRQAEQKLRQAEQRIRRAEQAARPGRLDDVKIENKPEIKKAVDAKPVPPKKPANNTKTESLGVRNIEGINAEGTRTITTIPAGAIGNLRAIEIVYEKWYSPELQLIVAATHNDPAFGEQTYKLTNIQRTEPAISLFSPPADYRIISAGGSGSGTGVGSGSGSGSGGGAGNGNGEKGPKPSKPPADAKKPSPSAITKP